MSRPEWSNMHTELNVRDLVYVDAFLNEWVPGRIIGYTADGRVRVVVTAERPGYRRGEEFTAEPNAVTPRRHRYLKGGRYFIRGSWVFVGLPEEHQPRWASPEDVKYPACHRWPPSR